ncbi:TPA: hypothetical protein ACLBZX_005129 [Bacillus cereus]|uniref:hypothetical protein n=1 Tax=Bacillus cereus group TaxID=86661 RepID=UPI000BA1F2C0|nr:hypothetical protein [Bacillus thuringiensis]
MTNELKHVFITVLFDKDKMPVAYTKDAGTYEEAVELGKQGLTDIEEAQYFNIEKYYTKGEKAE